MSLYEVLKASKLGGGVPNYWTELFARRMAGWTVSTITGTLPLTFTAKAGNAVDWTISGNDENGTENLFDIPDNTSIGYNNYYASAVLSADVISTISSYLSQHIYEEFSWYVDIDTTYTGSYYFSIVLFYSDGTYQSFQTTRHFTPSKTVVKIEMRVVYNNAEGVGLQYTFKNITIVKGSTAPDHYIPYQKGVGERTENLVEGVIEGSNIDDNGVIVMNTMYNMYVAKIVEGQEYTITTYSSFVYGFFRAFPTINSQSYNNSRIIGERRFTAPIDGYIAFRSTPSDTNIMLTEGIIVPPEYIPYGYQISLAVLQQGQTDKSYTFYIGDTPLTEGQQVSKTSTGQNIELFEGENVVSTTLYNKPDMEIKYK